MRNAKQGDIKHLRLMNGDEVITEINNITNEIYLIINPMYPAESETGDIVLMHWAPYNKTSLIELKNEHVLACTDVHEEMRRLYYLSLKVAANHEKATIDALRRVNNDMEQALVSPRRRRAGIVAPGSNLKH